MAINEPVTLETARRLVSELIAELGDPEDHLGSVVGAKLAFALQRRTGVMPHKVLGFKRLRDFLEAECPDVIIEKDDASTDMRVSLRATDAPLPAALTEMAIPALHE